MIAVQRRQYVSAEGVRLSYLLADQTAGQGPLVVFCHGFPGLAYSWRHQLQAVAAAGYQAVALDMRGYGDSDAPAAVADYSLDHIRADLVALLDERACAQAVFVGHDFGAPVVWHMALAEPARVAGLVVLSVPYDFDYYGWRGQDGEARYQENASVGNGHVGNSFYSREYRPGAGTNKIPRERERQAAGVAVRPRSLRFRGGRSPGPRCRSAHPDQGCHAIGLMAQHVAMQHP